MWCNVFKIGFGTECDQRIDFEVKWIGEWWIMESGERIDDVSVVIVISEVVIRQGLEHEINESKL